MPGYRIHLLFCLLVFILAGCGNQDVNLIKEIHIGLHNNNELKIQVEVSTIEKTDLYVEYWPDSIPHPVKIKSVTSLGKTAHSLVLCNIIPSTKYKYDIVTISNGKETRSKEYDFESKPLPFWLEEQFKYNAAFADSLPGKFKTGWMLLNKRETPGVAYIVDYKGRIRWYHVVDKTGFKVTHFTKDTTILSILGKNDEPTSYGSEILEVNLNGDTVLHLKKGQGDFNQVIHHEILKNDKGQIVTLFVDKRVIDLRTVGGAAKDTVNGDGILILDKQGKKLWQWSVFDVVDPLGDPKLLATKKDWMHANSLNYDKDGNYLISFYNNGQIWKVDAATGRVIWKFGKAGTIIMPADCSFSQAHAVHINQEGSLMFFDNGVEERRSEIYAVKIDEAAKTSQLTLHIKLPGEIYNDRMGSAYMINDTTVLCCSSKRHITVLTNRKGVLLWTLDTAIPPYRVEFIDEKKMAPYLIN